MLWEDCLMPLSLALWVEQRPRPVGFAIVFQLEGVTADKYLRWTYEATQHLLIVLHKFHIHIVRSVARHDQQYGNRVLVAAGFLPIICQMLEYQPFVQGTEGGCHL